MSKILSIREGAFERWMPESQCAYGYDGYCVTTDEGTVLVGISNDQHCCEGWGWMASDDDIARFVGADLLGVAVVGQESRRCLRIVDSLGLGEGDEWCETYAMFVDFMTSVGKFQVAVYNSHNGYYGHRAVLVGYMGHHSTYL